MKKNRKYFIFGVIVTVSFFWALDHFKSDLRALNSQAQEKLAQVNQWL
jgi:hypothetical protein